MYAGGTGMKPMEIKRAMKRASGEEPRASPPNSKRAADSCSKPKVDLLAELYARKVEEKALGKPVLREIIMGQDLVCYDSVLHRCTCTPPPGLL